MLEFSDAAYRFFPAEPSPFLIRTGRALNRHIVLPGKNHLIREIRIEGETEAIRETRARGDRLLYVINHPSHSDPQVITEVHRQLGQPSSFMAAYDVFLRSRLAAWSMQKLGHFSIDRESGDRKAMAMAIDILSQGQYALNIFPEGNVYLTNDRVTPFLDGTAFIALKAQQGLDDARIRIVPISLKFTHLTAPRETVTRRMIQLGEDSGYHFAAGSTGDPMGSMLGLGQHILRSFLKKHGYETEMTSHGSSVYEILERFSTGLVTGLEEALALPAPKDPGLVDRIRKIRSAIHQIRTAPEGKSPTEMTALARRAILAIRVNGYLTPYLTEHPTIDRYDETVERVAEDFYSRAMPRTGPRRAIAMIHQPIDVRAALEAAGGKLRDAVSSLTRGMESAVQAGVHEINRANDAPGATLVVEAG
ncbi:MAG: 1-acyl-sn-glycerol-3-phosphate acyltransferase [Verrucomicrobiales bacterium]|jgi:1-acyl-sn-glycerol-3-phosphate acyltransferase|nr:1-acyl-sn-glycerol-3-phosphate acyltransferase [Verrucomicrobiales bacterium]MDP5004278.1 1-acyl-sn-glycerol-3-phosphate acyltransferase [Verrucomicrobiales bacterium]